MAVGMFEVDSRRVGVDIVGRIVVGVVGLVRRCSIGGWGWLRC